MGPVTWKIFRRESEKFNRDSFVRLNVTGAIHARPAHRETETTASREMKGVQDEATERVIHAREKEREKRADENEG